MDATPNLMDPAVGRTRWGGILLTFGVALSLVSLSGYVFGTQTPAATDGVPERAQKVVDSKTGLMVGGWAGIFGDVLIILAALFLLTRLVRGPLTLPVSAFWLLVAFGFLIFLPLDLLSAGALVRLAEATVAEPRLKTAYEMIEAVSGLALGLAILVSSVGFAVVFYGETKSSAAVMPAWLGYLGILGCLGGVVAGIGVMTANEALGGLVASLYVAWLPALWIGLRLGFAPAAGRATSGRPSRV